MERATCWRGVGTFDEEEGKEGRDGGDVDGDGGAGGAGGDGGDGGGDGGGDPLPTYFPTETALEDHIRAQEPGRRLAMAKAKKWVTKHLKRARSNRRLSKKVKGLRKTNFPQSSNSKADSFVKNWKSKIRRNGGTRVHRMHQEGDDDVVPGYNPPEQSTPPKQPHEVIGQNMTMKQLGEITSKYRAACQQEGSFTSYHVRQSGEIGTLFDQVYEKKPAKRLPQKAVAAKHERDNAKRAKVHKKKKAVKHQQERHWEQSTRVGFDCFHRLK